MIDPVVIEAELNALVRSLRSLHAGPALDAWSAVWALQDPDPLGCPQETVTTTTENGMVTYFQGLCVTLDEVYFKGPMTTYALSQSSLEHFEIFDIASFGLSDGTRWDGRFMKGQTDIFDLIGDVEYNCSCTAGVITGSNPTQQSQSWASFMDGPTHWSGPEDDGTWMGAGDQLKLLLRFDRTPPLDYFKTTVLGSVSGLTETYGLFDVALMVEGQLSTPDRCAPSSGGSVWVRHSTTGHRVNLNLMLPRDAEDCVACGTLEGSEVCVDLSVLQDWEDTPWQ